MKVAFAIIPEKGHVNPYIGPAQALVDDGHEVMVAAPGDIGRQIAEAGLTFRPDLIAAASGRVTRGAELVALIQDGGRLHAWIEELLLSGIPESVEQVRDWYRRERPDAVVIDPLYYAAAIAAHVESIPWASVSNSLNPVLPSLLGKRFRLPTAGTKIRAAESPAGSRAEVGRRKRLPHISFDSALLGTVRALSARRAAIFAECGYGGAAFSGCDVNSPFLTVAFTTEALVGRAPAGVTLAGPSLPLRLRGDEVAMRELPRDRPVIYVSFGSQIYCWPEIFEKMRAAGKELQAHLVLAMGDLADNPRWARVDEHCHVYRYAPQPEILKRAAAFVTHGGANSVMEAIAAGVPMLLSPMCNDQFHQAFFVDRAGIGCIENLVEAPVGRIVEYLRRLIEDGAIRSRMHAVSRTYQTNGAVTTARLVAHMARSSRAQGGASGVMRGESLP